MYGFDARRRDGEMRFAGATSADIELTIKIETMSLIKTIVACMLASATAFVAPVSNVASSVSLRAVPEIASAISTLRVARVSTKTSRLKLKPKTHARPRTLTPRAPVRLR